MRTTTIFAICLTTALCLSTLLWQRKSIGALKRETVTLTRKIAEDAPTADPLSGQPTAEPTSPDRKPPTAERLLALTESETQSPGGIDFYGRVRDVLREVEDCNVAQLLSLVRQLQGDLSQAESSTSSAPYLQMMLLIVIAEEDPIAVLELLDGGEVIPAAAGMEMRPSVLAMLAKTDPELALSKVEREGITEGERDAAHVAIARALLASDVKTAFELMEGVRIGSQSQGMAGIVATSRDPQVTANLWREGNQMKPGKLRSEIFEGLLGAAMLQGGGASVEADFRRIENLEEDELNTLIGGFTHDYLILDPSWTLEFATEHVTGEKRVTILSKAIVEWARTDFNAAGTWLGTQPPSPERDGMISSFVRQIAGVDRAAATVWAGEIRDEGLRAAALKQITHSVGGTTEFLEPTAVD